MELWRTDGKTDDARKILDFPKTSVGSGPSNLTAIDGKLYYSAWDRGGGRGLFLLNPNPPPPATPAEIDVRGNGQSIASGDTTPVADDHTDFGIVTLGQSQSQLFEIVNVGERRLHLLGSPRIEIRGANAADFRVTKRPPPGLSANEQATFEITFKPTTTTGLSTATVRIASDDADESAFEFTIQGSGQSTPL